MVDNKTATSSTKGKGSASPNQGNPEAPVESEHYEIKIRGHLDKHWSEWLGSLEITQDEQGNTLLTGVVPDQAALHGILNQIRDLGLSLVSIIPQSVDDHENEEDANLE